MIKERMRRQLTVGNLICLFAYDFFECFAVTDGQGEELFDKKEMKQFFLDFGVH